MVISTILETQVTERILERLGITGARASVLSCSPLANEQRVQCNPD
jgi:hypothetical protein